MSEIGFSTQRRRLLEAYAKSGEAIMARTLPYHSTSVIQIDVVDVAGAAAPDVAYGVVRKNQVCTFFNYGVGDQIFLGGSANVRATEADTNQGKGASTNGAQDFVIEGVSLQLRNVRCKYAANAGNLYGTDPTDPDVLASFAGDAALYDPAAINMPPQISSPFNLEMGVWQSLMGLCSIDFLFDRKRTEKIGTADLIPCASAKSQFRANGTALNSNLYRIPEGYLWRRDGQPDSELNVNLTVQRPLVIPMNGIIPYPAGAAASAFPTTIWLELTMRLFGLAVDLPSAN